MLAPLASDPVSNFIVQHNLLPLLWPYVFLTAIKNGRKIGSALRKVTLDGIQGFKEVFVCLCDCVTHCRVKLRRCRRELRAEARPPEKVKALARRAGAG